MQRASSKQVEVHRVMPDFLVIGVPRAGTTWLHEAMLTHPQIGVPTCRKELHYFDRNFGQGRDWYSAYFEGLEGYERIGEVTPAYLYVPSLPDRLRTVPSIRQLIVVLRDPVERLVSHYRWRVRQDGYSGSLEAFVEDYPESLNWGEYDTHLRPLSSWIDDGRLLVLSHEALHDDDSDELRRLAEFLGVDESPFRDFGNNPVNASRQPRFPVMWRAGTRLARWLRDRHLDGVVEFVRKSGLKRSLETNQLARTTIEETAIQRLQAHYRKCLRGIDVRVGRNLSGYWPWMRGDGAMDSEDRGTGS